MKIGELARRAGCSVPTVRYYEREGLLPPVERTEGNYRRYRAGQLERLGFILHCRALDMTLEEIRQLLALEDAPAASCAPVNQVLDRHIAHVETRIAGLEVLRQHLHDLRQRCGEGGTRAECGILRELRDVSPVEPVTGAEPGCSTLRRDVCRGKP